MPDGLLELQVDLLQPLVSLLRQFGIRRVTYVALRPLTVCKFLIGRLVIGSIIQSKTVLVIGRGYYWNAGLLRVVLTLLAGRFNLLAELGYHLLEKVHPGLQLIKKVIAETSLTMS